MREYKTMLLGAPSPMDYEQSEPTGGCSNDSFCANSVSPEPEHFGNEMLGSAIVIRDTLPYAVKAGRCQSFLPLDIQITSFRW